MQHVTTDLYEALALWEADQTQWITEDTLHPGTFCLGPLEAMPEGQHWDIVCPEELAARRDALEDEQARRDASPPQGRRRGAPQETPPRRTRTFYGPGCPHCGHLYATRSQARRHQCDPQERERWQAHLQLPTGTPPGTVDLGNGFVLRLPTDDD